jgi:hypothetical protein
LAVAPDEELALADDDDADDADVEEEDEEQPAASAAATLRHAIPISRRALVMRAPTFLKSH